MITNPLHGYKKSRWIDEKTLEITLEVIINYEMERLLHSYADSVAVIQPLNLVERLKYRLVEALSQYQ